MTEDFKKGLATGLAIGGITVNKNVGDGIQIWNVNYVKPNVTGVIHNHIIEVCTMQQIKYEEGN